MAKAPWSLGWSIVIVLGMGVVMPAARAGDQPGRPAKAATASASHIQPVETFDTSFTGKDLLRTRLQARNITPYNNNLTGTQETRLGFDGNEGNAVLIDKLFYRFGAGDNFRVQIDAANVEFYDSLISTLSPFESSGAGAVSRFGRFSSIYRVNNPQLNNTGLSSAAGITAAYKLCVSECPHTPFKVSRF